MWDAHDITLQRGRGRRRQNGYRPGQTMEGVRMSDVAYAARRTSPGIPVEEVTAPGSSGDGPRQSDDGQDDQPEGARSRRPLPLLASCDHTAAGIAQAGRVCRTAGMIGFGLEGAHPTHPRASSRGATRSILSAVTRVVWRGNERGIILECSVGCCGEYQCHSDDRVRTPFGLRRETPSGGASSGPPPELNPRYWS